MTFKRWAAVVRVAPFLFALALPRAAAAQTSSGPMTVTRIGNSAFVAPDFKITEFNGKACGLAGAYGGYLVENAFFIGAGGYWLTDTSPERDMWYFGLVTGVYVNRDRPVGFGFKALIGGGEATIGQQYSYAQPRRGGQPIAVSGTSRACLPIGSPRKPPSRKSTVCQKAYIFGRCEGQSIAATLSKMKPRVSSSRTFS